MIEIDNIEVAGKNFTGIKVDTQPAPIVIIKGERGFIMCGALSIEAANKTGMTAASVSGVKTFDDLLNKEIGNVSAKARELGIKEGMLGRDALKLL